MAANNDSTSSFLYGLCWTNITLAYITVKMHIVFECVFNLDVTGSSLVHYSGIWYDQKQQFLSCHSSVPYSVKCFFLGTALEGLGFKGFVCVYGVVC
jgi:hypothetical protein